MEKIGKKLTTTVSKIIPLYLSEAETESYPYAVYEQTVTEQRCKEGVMAYKSSLTVYVYSKSFEEADGKADLIAAAIAANMNTAPFISKPVSRSKTCTQGVWCIELEYFVKQTN